MGNLRKYNAPPLFSRRERLLAALRKAWAWLDEPSPARTSTTAAWSENHDGIAGLGAGGSWCDQYDRESGNSLVTSPRKFFGAQAKRDWINRIDRIPAIPDPPQVAIETIKNGGPARVSVR